MKRTVVLLAASSIFLSSFTALAQSSQPNVLVIWGDDIGIENISYNNRGMMGYQTPNIDRIAKEGLGFTDYYAQQSCTAGRAAFIGGSVPIRSGMTKVGLPGAKEGWQKPTSLWPRSSRVRATPLASLARTIRATWTSIFRRCMDSMSSSATSTT